jgi:hypothetical protein
VDQSDEGREFKTRITEQIGSAANPHQRDCAWVYRKPGLGGASPQLLCRLDGQSNFDQAANCL